ncbi:MAG: Uma2 family endonuclease [Solirubrobacteraceae bacterium]
MATAERLITADEYLQGEEEHFVELIDGRVVMEEPTFWHQALCGRIYHALCSWTEAAPDRGAASLPVNVRLDEHNVFGPDVSWFREDRRPGYPGRWVPAPDLVAEVRSPSTWKYDLGRKREYYERFGVVELWLVDIATESVVVFRRSSAAATGFDCTDEQRAPGELTSPLLPGFALALAKLFEQ